MGRVVKRTIPTGDLVNMRSSKKIKAVFSADSYLKGALEGKKENIAVEVVLNNHFFLLCEVLVSGKFSTVTSTESTVNKIQQ